MKKYLLVLVLSGIGLAGCNPAVFASQGTPANTLNELKSKLTFTCVHEATSELSVEADVVFQYARWLQKSNQLKRDADVNIQTERLYRIAAEHGHYKANIKLQNGSIRGHFQLSGDEHLRLSQQLIDAPVATGYYFLWIFLKNGSAGLEEDQEMALRYLRKVADEGNAQAQVYVADKLAPSNMAPDVARQMRRCAAEQGHGDAAVMLSIYLKDEQRFQEAVELLQLGVAAGDEGAAGRLADAFRNPRPSDELHYLGLAEDLERADRYEKIWRILAHYSYANPKVPEINEIVPLPPAPLPAWDGKLQWLETRLADVPPPKPSEVLIKKLAKEKALDPVTGKPMPGSSAVNQTNFSPRVVELELELELMG